MGDGRKVSMISDEFHLMNLIERLLAAFQAKDLHAALNLFADTAVLIDPHYPTPHMIGKTAIAEGLGWAFANIQQSGFSLSQYYQAADGQSAAVELATNHLFRGGMRASFTQVFVLETQGGLITRLQAYEPYGPGGIPGLILGITRLLGRIRRR